MKIPRGHVRTKLLFNKSLLNVHLNYVYDKNFVLLNIMVIGYHISQLLILLLLYMIAPASFKKFRPLSGK